MQVSTVNSLGFFVSDGGGNMNGVLNSCPESGCTPPQNLVSQYQIDATGRAVVSGTLNGVMYVVHGRKVAVLPTGPAPALSTYW